jgi:superfamily II DNA or RNA helicase
MNNKEYLAKLQFRYPWRKYQKLILDKYTDISKLTKAHIVAPPGSGKTIVGLELIKRIGEPAVIFSPTSTIQGQWKTKINLFLDDTNNLKLDDIASKDPKNIKLINTYTYQLISSVGENNDFVKESGLLAWQEEMIQADLVDTVEEAVKHQELLRINNPKKYNSFLSKYYKKIKTRLLKEDNSKIFKFLHPNAKKLIDDLVSSGVKTLVLDESHHLLDYWAIVIKALISKIDNCRVIGLTATPPIEIDDNQSENYYSILGDIDFEVPTPAVVKEGNLAPFQDLVYFVSPSKEEKSFIKNLQENFNNTIIDLLQNDIFKEWLYGLDWNNILENNVMLTISCQKLILNQKWQMPDIGIFEEAYAPFEFDDWVIIISNFCSKYLITVDREEARELYNLIKTNLKNFGFVLTEKGVKTHRSVADRILSISESKAKGAVEILAKESSNMKNDLRAVVITDYEQESAFIKNNLKNIIKKEIGSAISVFEDIVHDPRTTILEPILVTGRTLLIDADEKDIIYPAMLQWRDENKYDFEIILEPTQNTNILKVVGKGGNWKSSNYVAMVTALFEKGITKCLVGTRGLLAEGWDSLSLNTLIDLTTATTSTTVQQLRGRSIRLDPNNPTKLANNWDVVCIEKKFIRGDQDLIRFVKKHDRFYGIDIQGNIVKGIGHVHFQLLFDLINLGYGSLLTKQINQLMLWKSGSRKTIYQDWKIGEPYSNFYYSATQIRKKDIKFKTVATYRDTIRSIIISIINLIISGGAMLFIFFINITNSINGISIQTLMIFSVLLLCFFGVWGILSIYYTIKTSIKAYKLLFVEIPVDYYLLDMAKALLLALKEINVIDKGLSTDNLRAIEDPYTGYINIFLDYANPQDQQIFSQQYQEMLKPLIKQRYLIERSDLKMRLGMFSIFWVIPRVIYGIFFKQNEKEYHAVPSQFAISRKKAQIFAKHWQQYVGGGKIIYTRNIEGAKILLEKRRKTTGIIKKNVLDYWK